MIGGTVFFGCVFVCMLCVTLVSLYPVVYAAESKDYPCSVRIRDMSRVMPPITIHNGTSIRSNPDGSLYPGDAAHFLYKFSGSDTCVSFSVNHLIGSENILFTSSLKASPPHSSSPLVTIHEKPDIQRHPAIYEAWVPKYLATHHYYKIVDQITKCTTHKGGSKSCSTKYFLSENPIVSIRSDHTLTESQKRKINKYKSNFLRDDIQERLTFNWHLSLIKKSYSFGVDEHILEDNGSVDRFTDIINRHCGKLVKHQGCVFGHYEVRPDAHVQERQICLFDELNKRNISFDHLKETNECITKKVENKTSLEVRGTGIRCNDKGKCNTYHVSRTDDAFLRILAPNGDVLFRYLPLQDSDGFDFRNEDGTYYPDDVIGIHAIPDARFKEDRAGTLSFVNSIENSTLNSLSKESCNVSSCKITLSNPRITPSTHDTTNGDMVSAHYTSDSLGIAAVPHKSELYNLDRYIGLYTSVADPLVVCYNPVISDIGMWSYLADAGNTSFDNRYSAAVQYDGSTGGCKDDPSGLYPDRRVKITDVVAAFVQVDNFGVVANVTLPGVIMSDGASIADMDILDSVRGRISNYTGTTVAHSYDGPILALNYTVQDVQIHSAGFVRLLLGVPLDAGHLIKNFVNVTSYNTLISSDFGGVDIEYLAHDTYEYPWGFFTAPFNVTAYKYVPEDVPCQKEFCDPDLVPSIAVVDRDVTVHTVRFSDVENSVSLSDFYLNYHRDQKPEWGYMHLADLYDMNVPQHVEGHTGEFLLNKTAVSYDESTYEYLRKSVIGGDSDSDSSDNNNKNSNEYNDQPSLNGTIPTSNLLYNNIINYTINQSPRTFTEGLYDTVAQITVSSPDVSQRTNTIPFDDVYLKHPTHYSVNMYPDNRIDIRRATTAVSIPYYIHFGAVTNVTVDGAPAKNVSCNDGCVIILPDDDPIDIVATNVWGGQIVDHNLLPLKTVTYNPDAWMELLPLRLFWIAVAIVLLYVLYRGLKAVISSRQDRSF